jgi:3'-phosphoadenosine 5'-phosphosulfate sulfotransferase (PAPS reductase)/FAD synthetase
VTTRVGALPDGRRRLLHRRGRVARATPEEVVDEVAATRITERGATRADDRASEAAMEDRKREGYF